MAMLRTLPGRSLRCAAAGLLLALPARPDQAPYFSVTQRSSGAWRRTQAGCGRPDHKTSAKAGPMASQALLGAALGSLRHQIRSALGPAALAAAGLGPRAPGSARWASSSSQEESRCVEGGNKKLQQPAQSSWGTAPPAQPSFFAPVAACGPAVGPQRAAARLTPRTPPPPQQQRRAPRRRQRAAAAGRALSDARAAGARPEGGGRAVLCARRADAVRADAICRLREALGTRPL